MSKTKYVKRENHSDFNADGQKIQNVATPEDIQDAVNKEYCDDNSGGMNYVDRGDPSEFDFTLGDFITDGNWHELDLSSIVPEGTKAVHFRITIQSVNIANYFVFRKKGNINERNKLAVRTQVATVPSDGDGIVSCSVDRKIEYKSTNTTFQALILNVSGWFI